MPSPKHVQLKTISLRDHPTYNEYWLQDVIADEPKLLDIGDVFVKDREKIQPGAGRLDLLLQETDGHGRYEVEIQLGATDASHIVRTIEYWDIERRRYPQFDHTAVIVAEDITSRFLNVIGLFNGFIPIMALQLSAIETPEGIGLHFTKVLDTVHLGVDDDADYEPVNRAYWETKRPKTVPLVDTILGIVTEFASGVELSYNQQYIGFRLDGKACNFAKCMPQKNALRLNIRLPQAEELDEKLDAAHVNRLDYDKQWKLYRLRLQSDDVEKHRALLKELLREAFEHHTG